ncbi:hypothetical protein K9B35_00025 [Sphingomonas sp. R647]|uniref:hypothetical protein n=1 Tax=Sphingomonas sp. R647 TaxID=2875233 RepID=UPI001CD50633|nr:hypothetical protein [Sphingomonas sp. R647]MCA1196340.1 hypothetical protein [Sphingomonas sp. R647]
MDPQIKPYADHAEAAVSQPRNHARKVWSTLPTDLALTGAVIVAGALVHWQFESHTTLFQALATPAAPVLAALILLWTICAAVHLYRRRSAIILLTAVIILAPALLQLPYLYLCSEGHCA